MIDLTRFKAVIFDFDGVIVDSESMQARAWTRVWQELGCADRHVHVSEIAGRIDVELAKELFVGHDAAWCANRKWEIEAEMEAAGELQLVDGVDRLVRGLAAAGRAVAVCSSCDPELIARRLDRFELREQFAAIVGRTEGIPHKPAPDLYLRALARLGVAAGDACAIEDSPTGVAAAKAAGVFAIQLLHPGVPRSPLADEWIHGLDELSRSATDRL